MFVLLLNSSWKRPTGWNTAPTSMKFDHIFIAYRYFNWTYWIRKSYYQNRCQMLTLKIKFSYSAVHWAEFRWLIAPSHGQRFKLYSVEWQCWTSELVDWKQMLCWASIEWSSEGQRHPVMWISILTGIILPPGRLVDVLELRNSHHVQLHMLPILDLKPSLHPVFVFAFPVPALLENSCQYKEPL